MKSALFNRVTMLFVTVLVVFSGLSCVQEEYEISEDNLNMEVTVFQEGVSIPLGSTEAIKVSQLLDELDPEIKEMFTTTDGAYAFNMSETFDFSEDLSFLSESFAIDGFSASEKFPFNLSDVNVSDVTVPEIDIPFEQKLSEVIPSVDLEFDVVIPDPDVPLVDISGYLPSDDELNVDLQDFEAGGTIATLNPVSIPLTNPALAPYADTELPVDEITTLLHGVGLTQFSIDTFSDFEVNEKIDVPVKFTLPKMITAVNDVQFDKDAKIRISVDLSDNMFFTSGKIIPHVDLDIHEIFHLTDEENSSHPLLIDHIVDDFILTGGGENPYSASGTYSVRSLVLDEDSFTEDKNGNLVFENNISVSPSLTLKYENLKTSIRYLADHSGGPVEMTLKVEFLDFRIDNVEVAVEPVVTNISTDFDISFSESLPELVSGIKDASFTEESGLNLDIDVANVNRIAGLDLAVESIEIEFPDGIKVKGADADNKYTLPVGSLADGKTSKKISVTGIEFDPDLQQSGKIAFDGKVKMSATASVSVKKGQFVNTRDLPKTSAENISLDVKASASFEVDDFNVDFDGYYYSISEKETIEFEVSKEVADLGKVVIVPETAEGKEPVITIDIDLPETKLPIGASKEGLVIDFPDMIVFKELSDDIKPYYSNGKLTFTDRLPSHIELPIDYIEAEAVKTQKDGKEVYVIKDVFTVEGKVVIAPGVAVKADVDALTAPDAVVSFKAYVPELVPSTVSVDMYQVEIPENTIEFGESIDFSSLPEELVSVGEIHLKDVALDVDVKAPGISDIIKDADVNLLLDVTVSDVIMLENPVEDGVIRIEGKLAGDEIEVDPVKVLGLKINKTAKELSEYMKNVKVSYAGTVSIKDATLDMGALEDIDLNVDISLMTAGSDNMIEISKVTGKVDYSVEPVSVDVDLSSLTGALNTDELKATLDLNRYSLALEIKTNLSIPLVADLAVVPYKNDAPVEGKRLEETLVIRMPEASAQPSLIRFWISNFPKGTDPYMPQGYEHVSLDLLSLIKENPDRLQITLDAGTDPESDCSIAASADGYVLEAAYSFSLPFEFGKDMALEFNTVIPDLPEELGTILQYGSLALTGEIESSLPFGLDMTYNFLDSNGNRIDLVDNAGKQTIQPGTINGEAVKTDINILVGVKKTANLSDIDALELSFKANSVPGAPLKEDSFIKAKLQVLVPEGVTLDLKDFMSEEE